MSVRGGWRALAGVGVVATAGSAAYVVWALRTQTGLHPSDVAGLVSMVAGVVACWAAVQALRGDTSAGVDVAGAAGRLALQVSAMESRQLRQLLGSDIAAIDVPFTFQPSASRNAAGARHGGRLKDVVTYYQRLRPQRLVVTGEAGAGKTVLAMELMLALIRSRGPEDPVPVRISAASWDSARPLEHYLTRHLIEVYRQSAAAAGMLVAERRILPVIDGVDEMDSIGAPVGGLRAASVITGCNAYQYGHALAPVVITCRTKQYDALIGTGPRLLDAARIQLRPVTAQQAATYLATRATDPSQWAPVVRALRSRPRGMLAQALSTPWRLNLAATVCGTTSPALSGNPADLITFTSDTALVEHLLSYFIPAAIAHGTPAGAAPHYTPGQTQVWLSELATHLTDNTGRALAGRALSTTDIALHRLWPMAGVTLPRRIDAVLAILTCLPFLTFMAYFSIVSSITIKTVLFAGVAVLFLVLAIVRAGRWWPEPNRLDLGRARTSAGCRKLVVVFAVGLTVGLASGLAFGLTLGLKFWLAVVITVGFASGLTVAVNTSADAGPTQAAGPTDPLRNDLAVRLAVGLAFALAGGLTFALGGGLAIGLTLGLAGGLTFSLGGGLALRLTFRLAVGLVLGLAFGLMAGLAGGLAGGLTLGITLGLGGSAWRRYTAFLVCMRRRLPWRLGRFLAWCYGVGLLRIAGIGYQFRHRELQEWLQRHPPI